MSAMENRTYKYPQNPVTQLIFSQTSENKKLRVRVIQTNWKPGNMELKDGPPPQHNLNSVLSSNAPTHP